MLPNLSTIVTLGTILILVLLSMRGYRELRGPAPIRHDRHGQAITGGAPRWLGLLVVPLFALGTLMPVWSTGASATSSGFVVMSVIAIGLIIAHTLYVRAAIRRAKAGEL